MNENELRKNKPDYLQGNVEAWTEHSQEVKSSIIKRWNTEPCWGIWKIPEAKIRLLPDDMSGLKALEAGCGTGYVSAWMARRGATVIGIDPTPLQLETAKEMNRKYQLEIQFMEGFGEDLPFEDSSFDFVISEYGAALWSDPYLWIPEASRVISPGGKLVFLTNSIFYILTCQEMEDGGPPGKELLRNYQNMHLVKWLDAPLETEFHLPHGKWIDLLTREGFRIDALHELSALPDSEGDYSPVTKEWAQNFPAEEVWVCTKV